MNSYRQAIRLALPVVFCLILSFIICLVPEKILDFACGIKNKLRALSVASNFVTITALQEKELEWGKSFRA
ncbi:hypothetical protein V6Z11_A08G245600 [Gossypium hirsutum]